MPHVMMGYVRNNFWRIVYSMCIVDWICRIARDIGGVFDLVRVDSQASPKFIIITARHHHMCVILWVEFHSQH